MMTMTSEPTALEQSTRIAAARVSALRILLVLMLAIVGSTHCARSATPAGQMEVEVELRAQINRARSLGLSRPTSMPTCTCSIGARNCSASF